MVHRLLSDLLFAIETDVQVWRTHTNKPLLDFINAADNVIFLHNTVHIISQLSDMVVYASGGLLALLSNSTSLTNERIESSNGMTFEQGFVVIHRLLNLVDVFVFTGNANFPSLETEKRMNPGGIIRQVLRLATWAMLRNILECRHKFARQLMNFDRDVEELSNLLPPSFEIAPQYNTINDITKLMQSFDISRLRATVYREIEDPKQSQFLALATVYFVSLLVVARYQDILQPDKVNQSPFQQQRTPTHMPPGSFTNDSEMNGEQQRQLQNTFILQV